MPTDGTFTIDLLDDRDERARLDELDAYLGVEDASRVVTVRASLERWDDLVRALCELRGRGVLAQVDLVGPVTLAEATLLDHFRFLAAWDQCSLGNVLGIVDRWLPDAHRQALQQEARFEARFFREWATAAVEPRLARYPALPWRRFLRNVNEENYRFAEACILQQNDPPALLAAIERLMEAKRRTVNLFPKKWAKNKKAEEATP